METKETGTNKKDFMAKILSVGKDTLPGRGITS